MGRGKSWGTFPYQKNILFASKNLILVGTLEKCVFSFSSILILKSYSTCGNSLRIAFETKAERSLKLKRLSAKRSLWIAFYIETKDEILHYVSFIQFINQS
ncbi:hypothetical protein LEP1GSC126_1485 [Leptospira kirschneri str. 200801774]|nr:hypothetical protein LEP1GSC126_1485 [Leptospira kirschneri str. 200801774]